MLIILEGANFSENNVGTIVIPRDALNETTQLILSKMTKSVTDSQKYALDDLIIGLKDSGIWDKIVHMFVPFFANSVAEALYNAKLDIPVTGITNSSSFASSGYLLDEYGLRTQPWITGTSLGISSLIYSGYTLSSQSLTIATLSKVMATTGKTYYTGVVADAFFSAFDMSSNIAGAQVGAGALYRRLALTSPIVGNVFRTINVFRNPMSTTEDIALNVNGTKGNITGPSSPSYINPNTAYNAIKVATSGFSNYQRNENCSVAVQIFGSELTSTEVTILDELLSNFHSKI